MNEAPSEESESVSEPISIFTVPVERRTVTLVLHDGARQEAVLSSGPGQPIERFFEAKETFLPVKQDGRIRLYARRSLACIAVSLADSPSDEELPLRSRPIAVYLRSGLTLVGDLRYVFVEGRARVTDVLNEDAPSFTLYVGDTIYHIAKEHVVSIEER